MTLYSVQGHPITLTVQLGSGGAGTVYEVEGQPSLVAKRYHQPPTPEQIARLNALVECEHERLIKIAAWPVAVLRDQPDGQVVGFLMPRVDRASEIHTLHSPKSRLQKFPDATWAFLIHTAANIARAVATVHEAGFVVGDVNPKNILVTRQGTVALLDCDSFQFESDGVTYRCEAGFPEYTPPELQGFAFRDVDRTAQHDAFGLAVIIFQLLFLGRHPFAGKFFGEGEMSLSRAIAEGRFAYGTDSAARQMHAPPGVLPWQALPDELARLFERTFLTTARPAPREWIEALEATAQTLTTCALHPGHRYAVGLAACPWCEIEMRARVKLFNVTRKGEGQPSVFRLDNIWREIEQIKAPDALALAVESLSKVQPSEATQKIAESHRNGLVLAILSASAGGFATAYLGGFCAFVGLGWMALVIAHFCLKHEPRDPDTLARWPSSTRRDSLAERIAKAREEASAKVRQLEQQWDWDINGRFASKRNELVQHRAHYATLDTTRDDRLQQLETAARQDYVRTHLEKFEVQNSEISGRVLTTYLKVKGIKTAADITRERLDSAHGLTNTHRTLLWNWRTHKEQMLTLLASDTLVHPTLRQRVLTETEAMRERLEAELRSGAFYLRRLRNEVEAAQLAVRDELLNAKQALAQAEADFKAAGKRRSLAIPVVVLVVAGTIGGSLPELEYARTHPAKLEKLLEGVLPSKLDDAMNGKAREAFDAAMEYRNTKTYDRAFRYFESAHLAAPNSEVIWDEWSYTYYLAGQYQNAIQTAKSAPHFGKTFRPHKNLGLAYAVQGQWAKAKEAYNQARLLKEGSKIDRESVEIIYLLGQTLNHLGELSASVELAKERFTAAPSEINKGEQSLEARLLVTLALYQRWQDDLPAAQRFLQSLRMRDVELAGYVEEFINSHPSQAVPEKAPKKKKK